MPTTLQPADLEAIAALEQRVVAADGGRLKLEWGTLRSRPADRAMDVLARDDAGRLIGFAGLYSFDGVALEVAGMVDPAHRRSGVGTALLAGVDDLAARHGFTSMLLVCPRTTEAGAAFARARGGVPEHSEFALELPGEPVDGPSDPAITLRPAVPEDGPFVARALNSGFGFDAGDMTARIAEDPDRHVLVLREGMPAGYLRTSLTDTTGRVFGFVIDAPLRGQGIGRDVLRRCCRSLRADGATRVGLEVASDNDHALGLYTSLGFEPVIAEDYFQRAVPVRDAS